MNLKPTHGDVMKVIIGAGPAGLYTAIKLRKAGLLDVVVYDPRAGEYTRPGHLNWNAFQKAEEGIGKKFWAGGAGHIKDLERALYAEALMLGIKIEKKRFVRLNQDVTLSGVVVTNTEGIEEVVQADYVFDCSGPRRAVVQAVNHLFPDSPLTLSDFATVPVPNHFLAYVKMDETQYRRLAVASNIERDFPSVTNALAFARSIIKLQDLGWKELKFPRCYGYYFGKGKACLYFQTPEGLVEGQYDQWVQAVIESYTTPIEYEHLSPSRKYKSKPRFSAFITKAQALEHVSYQGLNLPMVVALGDAQIDLDYALAHGIYDGFIRIDALFEQMEIFDNRIQYFDADEYLSALNALLREHKEAVIGSAKQQKAAFFNALGLAQTYIRQAVMMTSDGLEKARFNAMLNEIDARQSFASACELFAKYHDAKHNTSKSLLLETLISGLHLTHTHLLKAFNGLPASFAIEVLKTKELLAYMADSWKQLGNDLFKNARPLDAIDAYKKAMDIYNLPGFQGQHGLKEFPLYSNLAIIYNGQKLYSEAIAAVTNGLEVYANCSIENKPSAMVYEKLVFNLIKAFCEQAQQSMLLKNNDEARSLQKKARHAISTHQARLSGPVCTEAKSLLQELQGRLDSILRRALMQASPSGLERSMSVPESGLDLDEVLHGSLQLNPQTPNQLMRSISQPQTGASMSLQHWTLFKGHSKRGATDVDDHSKKCVVSPTLERN